jgi:hypothetical protein
VFGSMTMVGKPRSTYAILFFAPVHTLWQLGLFGRLINGPVNRSWLKRLDNGCWIVSAKVGTSKVVL